MHERCCCVRRRACRACSLHVPAPEAGSRNEETQLAQVKLDNDSNDDSCVTRGLLYGLLKYSAVGRAVSVVYCISPVQCFYVDQCNHRLYIVPAVV